MRNHLLAEETKDFFKNNLYNVMHEAGSDSCERYFIVIEVDDLRSNSQEFKDMIREYASSFQASFLSEPTQKYVSFHHDDQFFMHLGKIRLDDPLFHGKDAALRNNANNILAIALVDQPADMDAHVENKICEYSSHLKTATRLASEVATAKTKEAMAKGKVVIDANIPIIKEKLSVLKNKLLKK